MNPVYVDYFCLLIILFNTLLGFWRGLINEIFRIAAVIGAAIAVYLFNEQLAVVFTLKFGYSFFIWKLLSSIFIYSIVYVFLIYAGKLLTGLAKISMLSPMNRGAGAAFGAIRLPGAHGDAALGRGGRGGPGGGLVAGAFAGGL